MHWNSLFMAHNSKLLPGPQIPSMEGEGIIPIPTPTPKIKAPFHPTCCRLHYFFPLLLDIFRSALLSSESNARKDPCSKTHIKIKTLPTTVNQLKNELVNQTGFCVWVCSKLLRYVRLKTMPQRKIRNNDLSATVLRSKLMPCNLDARTISCTILALQVFEQASITRNAIWQISLDIRKRPRYS